MDEKRRFSALIVDDEHRILALASRAFAKEGIDCDTATNGSVALSKCEMTGYDFVVTDLRMPHMNGHALTVELLKHDRAPVIYVVTSVAEPLLIKDLLVRGVEDFLIKPVDFKLLAMKCRLKMESLEESDTDPQEENDDPCEETDSVEQCNDQEVCSLEQVEDQLLSRTTRLPVELLEELTLLDQEEQTRVDGTCQQFMTRLSRRSPYATCERRVRKRTLSSFTVSCVVYDAQFNVVGSPFKAIVRDISTMGMGIVSYQQINDPYLAISWTSESGENIHCYAEVLRCQDYKPFYDVGCRFIEVS